MSCAVASIYTMPNAIAQLDNICFKAAACGSSDDRRETTYGRNWVRFEKLANLDFCWPHAKSAWSVWSRETQANLLLFVPLVYWTSSQRRSALRL